MNLPYSNNLPVQKLAAVFGSKAATYKYYWLIAILELVEEGYVIIPKKKIFARMISNSWYTINYFKISFGTQDNLQIAVQTIINEEKLDIDEKKDKIDLRLEFSTNKKTISQLLHFDKNVPHWFLSTWFPKKNKSEIYSLSKSFENECLYSLHKDYIEVNLIWTSYLKTNSKILKDFCYWNLALFLQAKNPNVPDIPNKLIKPVIRSGLSKQTNEYWKLVFNKMGSIDCIFTKNKLYFDEKNYALDHFIPHAFVSHNLIWNLIPIDRSFNLQKSDKLPSIEIYFDDFFKLQKRAFEIVSNENPKSKIIEDYLTIFPQLKGVDDFDYSKYKESIQPLITIASNNGFLYMNE